MLGRASILLEIMAVIVCVYRMYNRKPEPDIAVGVLYLCCVIIYELENVCELGFFCRVAPYLLITVFCIRKFGDSLAGAVFCVFLMMVVMAIMQFFFMVALDFLLEAAESERVFVANILVLGTCIFALPGAGIYRLRSRVRKGNGFLLLLSVFLVCLVFSMQFQQRRFGEIQLLLFLLAMPMAAESPLLMDKYLKAQNEKSDVENELQITRSMQEKYDELIKSVRLRQHEFKNHLAAIFATHYTCKSYEKLVRAQEKYCGRLKQENRYNDLLTLGDAVMVGFLYGKFLEIEEDNIIIKFAIEGRLEECSIPVHHLVEITGILLDNAAQAVCGRERDRVVWFRFTEEEKGCSFMVSNPYPYVSYDEVETWFRMGSSTKGRERGVGLYRVRCLCREWGCSIQYKNTERDGENWIEFTLRTGKADKG